MQRNMRTKIIVAGFAAVSAVSAIADGPLCDREIEGVTVRMGADEVRTIWAAHGFVEITSSDPRQSRGSTTRIDFADRHPQLNEGYRSDRVTLSFVDTGKEVSVTKLSYDEGGTLAQARMMEFCPEGPRRDERLSCFSGTGRSNNISINADPEPAQNPMRCSYSFISHGIVNETVRLSREPAAARGTLPSSRPAPKRSPRG